MKRLLALFFVFLLIDGYCQNIVKPKLNWSIQNPLNQNVFIENNGGQFDKQAIDGDKVYYKATIKGVDIYFTDKGILYYHDEKIKDLSEKETDPDRAQYRDVWHHAAFNWEGANPFMQFVPEDETNFYYTYSTGKKHTVVAHTFKKLLCRDLYPGIDVEYSLQDTEHGLLCSIHLHPGIQSENIKLEYDGISSSLNETEKISVKNDVGDFAISIQNEVNTIDKINRSDKEIEVSAVTNSTLWITNPGFTGYDGIYDLCYDDSGYVYVYGGNGPYQLAKISSSGNLKWIYNDYFPTDSDANYFYGDFVTDKTSGTSYLAEALNDSLHGPEIVKINSAGMEVNALYMRAAMSEVWRMDLNYCTHQIILAGGGVFGYAQAAIIDTSLAGLSEFNVLNATSGKNDLGLLTCDRQQPYCYMASVEPNDGMLGSANSVMQCPIPSLWPPSYLVNDGYSFVEIFSNLYVDVNSLIPPPELAANGTNGIVATTNNLYLWDGSKITSINKNNGNILKTRNIHSTGYGYLGAELVTSSGIDADYCGNIYIGDQANIDLVDTNLNITGVINPPSPGDTVYDLHISPEGNLYACGYGFVASYFMPQSATVINKVSSPACSGCNGTAFVSISTCEAGQYSWSNGATGQVVTNLCAGTYTVSVKVDCATTLSDTIHISTSPNPSVTIPGADVKGISCFNENNGTAVAIASGGTPPYTYMWYPAHTSNDTITNLSPGTYTFIVTDIHGCASIDTVTINQPSIVSVLASVNGPVQAGQDASLTATTTGGTPPYTYVWNDGSTGAQIGEKPANTTTYTVTVTDNNGCTSTAVITVEVLCGDVFIPTAFSPTSVGYNNYLFVRGDCIANITFTVFDRWGNKVFESTNLTNGWDGKYLGQPMNTGTYVWYLKATLRDGTKIEKKGNVTLLR